MLELRHFQTENFQIIYWNPLLYDLQQKKYNNDYYSQIISQIDRLILLQLVSYLIIIKTSNATNRWNVNNIIFLNVIFYLSL